MVEEIELLRYQIHKLERSVTLMEKPIPGPDCIHRGPTPQPATVLSSTMVVSTSCELGANERHLEPSH